MKHGRYREALAAFNLLRPGPAGPLIAARDMYYAHSQLDVEARLIARRRASSKRVDEGVDLRERLGERSTISGGPNADPENPSERTVDVYLYQIRETGYFQRFCQLFSEPRCRRASICAATAMLTQQMTGVNVIGG